IVEPGRVVVEEESGIEAGTVGGGDGTGRKLSHVDSGQHGLPFGRLASLVVSHSDLTGSFEPRVDPAGIGWIILLESISCGGLVVALNERKSGALIWLCLRAESQKGPRLDIDGYDVLGNRDAVLTGTCPEVTGADGIPHAEEEMLRILCGGGPGHRTARVDEIQPREE